MMMMMMELLCRNSRGEDSPSAEHLQGNTIFSVCVCVFRTDKFKADDGRKTG